jgi:hypothetical protein
MKITSELTNITTTILLLTVQVYEEFKTKQELKELEQILEV